ncbi:prephenate dehydratase [Cellulomonas sp. McL0617]|uniref:prephenate dehydratase n=1 Tax=Cellulomonas sp. McL0617 TaxID=3415675 RepID=UPI003CFAB873
MTDALLTVLPRYAYLGPAGTFTEAALRQVVAAEACVDLPVSDVASAIDAVRSGAADFAVVAIESTVEGGVTATLDSLVAGKPLVILREVLVPVQFTLAAAPGVTLADVRRVSAHPHAWVQCRHWLASHLPGSVHVPATSNTAPAALIASGESPLSFDAALVPPAAVDLYNLVPLAQGIADNPSAQTRFVVIGKPGTVPPRTGADKTTLVVHLPDNEAGALLAMLEQFAARGVNLSRIESRPIGDALGRYSFSMDADGHITDERMGEAVMGLRRRCPFVLYLGSYPRADGVAPTVHLGTTDDDFLGARNWLTSIRDGDAT